MDGSVDVESGLRPERAWRKGGSRPEDGKGKAEGLGGSRGQKGWEPRGCGDGAGRKGYKRG